MKIMKMFFPLILAGNFQQRRRFQGFHAKRSTDLAQRDYHEPEMLGQDMDQAEISSKLQSLIDSMIIDRQKISIDNLTAWNLYKRNLNR